jgi:hypothetical protein
MYRAFQTQSTMEVELGKDLEKNMCFRSGDGNRRQEQTVFRLILPSVCYEHWRLCDAVIWNAVPIYALFTSVPLTTLSQLRSYTDSNIMKHDRGWLVRNYVVGGSRELHQGTITVSLRETADNHGKPQNNGPSSISIRCKPKLLFLEFVHMHNTFNGAKCSW